MMSANHEFDIKTLCCDFVFKEKKRLKLSLLWFSSTIFYGTYRKKTTKHNSTTVKMNKYMFNLGWTEWPKNYKLKTMNALNKLFKKKKIPQNQSKPYFNLVFSLKTISGYNSCLTITTFSFTVFEVFTKFLELQLLCILLARF